MERNETSDILLVEVNSKPAITEMYYFVELASLDNQITRGIPNYLIMFNVSYIGLSPWYHKTREIAIQGSD